MKKSSIKQLVYALLAAVVAFAVSFWISYKSAENDSADSDLIIVKKQSVLEIVAQLKSMLPMEFGTGIIWTDVTCENDVVIYYYIYSDLYASDVDQDTIDWVIANDKQEIINKQVAEYDSNKDTKDWIDSLIENRYKVQYRYCDCEYEYIYSFTIYPSDWEDALEWR